MDIAHRPMMVFQECPSLVKQGVKNMEKVGEDLGLNESTVLIGREMSKELGINTLTRNLQNNCKKCHNVLHKKELQFLSIVKNANTFFRDNGKLCMTLGISKFLHIISI